MREHFRWNEEFEIDLIGHWSKTMTIELWERHGHMMCAVPQHSTATAIKGYFELMGWNWDEYFKFGIVRNPFDRIVSGYEWRRTVVKEWFDDNEREGDKNHFKEIISETDDGFKEFVKRKCQKWNGQEQYFYSKPPKQCLVDFVGRYENLETDFKHIVKTILPNATDKLCTLKKANASIRRKDYRSYYNEETRDIVEQNLSDELELLRYKY
tara:strand:+ start:3096 stop:3728 length:633 start_codon:yes stop_codon:yes gene_type:complete